jgi:hypothetical protein
MLSPPSDGIRASSPASPGRPGRRTSADTATCTGSGVPPQGDVIPVLALSDERDRQLEYRLQAWREGWRAGLADAECQYSAGYARCAADVKAVHHALYSELERQSDAERGRWIVRGELRTRRTFGDPHPDDYLGQGGAA